MFALVSADVHRTSAFGSVRSRTYITKRSTPNGVLLLVPLTGIEPVRILLRGILSPLCLPVPPQRRIIFCYIRSAVPLPCCGARRKLRPASGLAFCRPQPLAPLAASAPGGAQVAPRALTDADLLQGIKSAVSVCSTTAAHIQLTVINWDMLAHFYFAVKSQLIQIQPEGL